MNKKIITSTNNLQIKEFAKLKQKKYRDKNKMFILENLKAIDQIENKKQIVHIFTTNQKMEGTLVSNEVMKKLSSQQSVPQVLAILKKQEKKYIGKRVLALDSLQDPKNVGTLIRSAKAFNFTDVLVKGVDIYSPKLLQASKGSFFKINVFQVDILEKYLEKKYVIGTLFKDKKALSYQKVKPEGDFVLLLGNEGHGISLKLEKFINVNVFIPVSFESLNVAIAGSILMNHYQK